MELHWSWYWQVPSTRKGGRCIREGCTNTPNFNMRALEDLCPDHIEWYASLPIAQAMALTERTGS